MVQADIVHDALKTYQGTLHLNLIDLRLSSSTPSILLLQVRGPKCSTYRGCEGKGETDDRDQIQSEGGSTEART